MSKQKINPHSTTLCLAFSLTALIFYVPANMFPFMSIELYGRQTTSTIWGGIVQLADSGSWPIAIVIFLASILIPLLKLLILFYLALTAHTHENPKFKTRLYQIVESIGRWSMLDIFLLAILVAILKLGHWAHAEPRLGSLLFLMVVIFTMLASAYFDPKLLQSDLSETESLGNEAYEKRNDQ
ncbi:paraquat-inducible protein A [Bdellovibrio sp. NC01]|uniref:paraquat-inducible protein A n=1 Tax=Bdellovibrio sp. NC01 TaxID=2220073 RepID=UPI001157B397|nr:paraquat-inducible protein A [Bdellovibrio sp. NC01]QDK39311.1 paraquat-inducible protein A [Bdellovibrio sp. NC01]